MTGKDYEMLAVEFYKLRTEIRELKSMLLAQGGLNRWLTMDEAAEHLRISRTTMSGRLTDPEFCNAVGAVREGRKWRFSAAKLEAYAGGLGVTN